MGLALLKVSQTIIVMSLSHPNTLGNHSERDGAISCPYLIVTTCNCCYVDTDGRRYLDALWAKDLALHADYILDLRLALPRIDAPPPPGFVLWDDAPRVTFIDLPFFRSVISIVPNLPRFVASLWRAISNSKIIHSGIAGWPLPDGWITIPFAKIQRRFVVVVVESDFWRMAGRPPSFRAAIRAFGSEFLNRVCVRMANAAFFTHQSYMDSLLLSKEHGYVLPASWIDEEFILSNSEASALWQKKLSRDASLRIAYVGRLIPEKGADVLMTSLESAALSKFAISCDIIGKGELLNHLKERLLKSKAGHDVRFLSEIEYGAPFFNQIDEYDAIVVPSLSNEQPRIVFDAFARAIPILGFRTDGLASCVSERETGLLCDPQDAEDLAKLLSWAATHRTLLAAMGMNGLERAKSMTHRLMHKRRHQILDDLLSSSSR